jgi:hypothetical protein
MNLDKQKEKLISISNELTEMVLSKNLSLYEAEWILEIAKEKLKHYRISNVIDDFVVL